MAECCKYWVRRNVEIVLQGRSRDPAFTCQMVKFLKKDVELPLNFCCEWIREKMQLVRLTQPRNGLGLPRGHDVAKWRCNEADVPHIQEEQLSPDLHTRVPGSTN